MIHLIDMDFSKSFNTPINLKFNNFHTKNTNLNPKSSLEIGNNSFSDEGLVQKVELFQFRNETFIRNNTDQGGVIIQNDIDGWNITNFELEFKSLNAKDAHVPFEARNDGFEAFKGVNQFFAVSFEIPNTCYLKNLTMLLQYWGTEPGSDDSEFSLRVYNATSVSNETIPDKPIDKVSDEVFFVLTGKPINLPAQWYYSNFTNLILNISKTVNNTFFAVFQSIEFPTLAGYTDDAYIAYAMETSEDKYNILFYKTSGSPENWNSLDGKNGLLKVNFAPISYIPTPDQINLTVFKTPLNSTGKFTNFTFFPHRNNEFFIPISSSWFGNIQFNVSFKGKFRYNTYASSHFKAEINKDVLWNLSLSINEFSRNSYNKSAHFYNPKLWEYNSLYNGTVLYSKFKIHSDYIEIYNISNHNWVIICNQRNEIITKSFLCSNDKTNWKEIVNCVYSTDYINITANFKNSNGQAIIFITSTNLDIFCQHTLENNKLCLPIWCPLQNTSIYENNSLIEIKIITFNGTIAGITVDYLRVLLVKNETSLVLTKKLRDYCVQGTKLMISAQLTCGDKFLVGEPVFFKIEEITSGRELIIKYLNDTICDEGYATVEYDIPNIDFFNIEILYQGNVRYYSSIYIKERIEVRSPIFQFFIDSLVYFILVSIVVIGVTIYYIKKRYQLKRKRIIWGKKTGFYNDITSIDYILVIEKKSGSAIIREDLVKIDLEGNLISGLLQVITYFKYELKKQRVEYDSKERILIDYQDYKILLKDGEFSRVALIVKQSPSENLQLELVEFIKHFEIKYKKYLEDFTGDLTPFQDYLELIDRHFKIHMTRPLIVNKISPDVKINTFQETLINTAKLLEKENKHFMFDKLLNDLIIIMPNEPKEKLLANIYNLIEFEYFHPIQDLKN